MLSIMTVVWKKCMFDWMKLLILIINSWRRRTKKSLSEGERENY
jgi:hypothetical protein